MQWLMLQQEQAEDFVIATGQQVSVRTFLDTAAAELGARLDWHGTAEQETGTVAEAPAESAMRPGQVVVRVDPDHAILRTRGGNDARRSQGCTA
jgi:GDPmannose 4,6-dehydratase